MHDRHKFIKLAVTNGVYDLDTIHSLYNSNNFEEGGIVENRRKKDNTEEEVINVDNQHDYKRIHWHEVDKSPTGNTAYGDVYQIRQPKDRKDFLALKKDIRETYPDAKIFVKNGTNYFRVPHTLEKQSNAEIVDTYIPEVTNITYTIPNKRNYLNYLPETKKVDKFIGFELGEPSINEVNEEQLQSYIKSREIFPGIKFHPYENALSFTIKDENNIKRNAFIKELNDAKKFANIINGYSVGGELPTEPNRLSIDTSPIIDRIRAERLTRYTAPDSALAQIKELTDNIRENEFRREFAEWINPTRNTNDYVDIRRIVPVAEAGPTFVNTYEKGGPKDPPYDWIKAWQQEANKQTTTQPIGKYNVVATDGKNSNYNYEKNVTPDLSWYKDPLENTRMVTEEPIESLYGFKDPVFNVALLGAGLANGAFKGAGTLLEDLATPGRTFVTKIAPRTGLYISPKAKLGAYIGDVIFNGINIGNGFSDLMSNNGINKTIQLLNNEDYGNAITSGLGDVLNALPLFNGPRLIRNFNSYRKQGNNIKNAINRTITGYTDRDLEHLTYFNMSPKQVAKRVNDDMNSINVGGKFLESNLSTDSYPLVLHSMLSKNSPNFKVYNTGKMMKLNNLGNLTGEQALGRINKKIAQLNKDRNINLPEARHSTLEDVYNVLKQVKTNLPSYDRFLQEYKKDIDLKSKVDKYMMDNINVPYIIGVRER